jgi:hypothetical protein
MILRAIASLVAITMMIIAGTPALADADAFPWKLLKNASDGNLYIAHEYASEEACRADGEIAAREALKSQCSPALLPP